MGIVDKAKDMMGDRSEQAKQGVDKAGDFADKKTNNKYSSQIDQGQEKAKDAADSQSDQKNRQQDRERAGNQPQPPAA